jgi:quercetin dioxygenase-like cupin family protein
MTTTTPRIRPGQTVENPVTGERFTFIETAASSGGELLAFDLALRPGGAVPIVHVHPIQTERFEVTSGAMRFRVGLRTVVATAGDVVEVAPGVMHSFANAGGEDAQVRVEVRPALAMEEMFADVVELANAGRMTKRGLPRNVLDLAVLARTYDSEAHAPFLGRPLQRILLAPLVALARLRRKGGAERAGFEPANELAARYSLSRRVPSASRPPLRGTASSV